jgi:HlyD family secretion protein
VAVAAEAGVAGAAADEDCYHDRIPDFEIAMALPRSLLLVPVLLAGCSKPAAAPTPPTAAAPAGTPAVVTIVQPKSVTLNWTVDQPATVHAFETTPLVAKLPGYVRKVHVDIGDTVTEGQLLAELTIPELDLEAEQKKALVVAAEADLLYAKKGIEVAKAQSLSAAAMIVQAKTGVERAEADAKRWDSERLRVADLVARKVVESQTLAETTRQFEAADAMRREALARVTVAEQQAKEAEAKAERAAAEVTVAEAKKTVAVAEANRVAALLAYTRIKAPFAGAVTFRGIHTGHFLQPNSSAKLDPLFVVSRQDVMRVVVDVPESASEKATVGAKALIRVPALSNREYSATITRTARTISPETRTLRVEIDLPNADGAIKPGLYATAKLSASTANALVVPAGAILYADETAYCYRAADGTVVKLRVQVGKTDGANLEILNWKPAGSPATDWKPFAGTESIVVGNLGALADGQAVVEKK